MERLQKLKSIVESMDDDCSKFHKDNVKASATRYRAKLLQCKKLCAAIRKDVQAKVKTIPVKRRSSDPIDIPQTSSVMAKALADAKPK